MYMFLQFYRDFTPQVLKDFYEDDSFIKEKEISMVSGREALRSATGQYSALSFRNQLLDYQIKDLPFAEMMENYRDTFERVFVEEKPNTSDKYYLAKINIIQIATTKLYDNLFSFTFTKHTTKEVDYASSTLVEKLVK